MTKLLPILLISSICLTQEMEVDGDLKVVGNVQVGTIDSLEQLISLQQQQILTLQGLIVQLQAQIALLESQMAFLGQDLNNADCAGVVGGDAFLDECGVCGGEGMPDGDCDCNGNVLDVCGICGGNNSSQDECQVIDIDGNTYSVVHIGNQAWFKENLKVSKYRNGNDIGFSEDIVHEGAAYNYYNNDESLADIYGYLYSRHVIPDSRGVCPEGFHVSTTEDWHELISFLGGDEIAGGKIKSTEYWDAPNTGATNNSGFTALPSGYWTPQNGNDAYRYIGAYTMFWASGEIYFQLSSNAEKVQEYTNQSNYKYPLRCVQN